MSRLPDPLSAEGAGGDWILRRPGSRNDSPSPPTQETYSGVDNDTPTLPAPPPEDAGRAPSLTGPGDEGRAAGGRFI